MKKLRNSMGLLLLAFAITGCSSEEKPTEPVKAEVKAGPVQEGGTVDVSFFEIAEKVKVTEAKAEKHIDLVITADSEFNSVQSGYIFRDVVEQTYGFLQQSGIEWAETVTVGVMQGGSRVAQFTVETAKFEAGKNKNDSVLNASTIDRMDDDIREFGSLQDKW
ncbi:MULTISPECIES: hypothetical protein [Peribacillus]|uniref:hypothetical protein n=1 Tax=Peribacillus TaxID=2675229 RepID=UPI001F4E149D|nr:MULTISPECIES: hypothetical protein [unclassified Peribacillus]MCK1985189.1 hypothetical protein [Peribacillus sp. Aquil_B1]MCK2007161.1 hypothetical protein [Peribacillus sp. Aquil_B8]